MASDLRIRAMDAFLDGEFEIAVELYTLTILLGPENAELFADRAVTNIRLGNFAEAISDAGRAVELDPSMSEAYFLMGNAFFELEKFRTAKAALEVGSSLAPANARFTNLIKRCDDHIAEMHGEILNPPLVKASIQVVPMEGGQESAHIVNEFSKFKVHLAKAERLNLTSLDNAVPHKAIEVSGAGSQRPSASKWQRVDLSSKLK